MAPQISISPCWSRVSRSVALAFAVGLSTVAFAEDSPLDRPLPPLVDLSKFVLIIGDVLQPQWLLSSPEMTLSSAIGNSGGTGGEFGRTRVTLVRTDLRAILGRGGVSDDAHLRPGDIIYVGPL